MSRFFEALERAEQEQTLRRCVATPEGLAAAGPWPARGGAVEPDPAPGRGPAGPVAISPGSVEEHLVSLTEPGSFAAEQFRRLAHAVESWHRESGRPSVLAVSSPTTGDGRTTTAANLAGALAQGPDVRALLVEADLRRPRLGQWLGLDGDLASRGLRDLVLSPQLTLADVAYRCSGLNLTVLPAGGPTPTPHEVLQAPRFEAVLRDARADFEYVLVDTPPILAATDCQMIGRTVDAFLLVVAAHRTPRRLVEEALLAIRPHRLLGLVFNGDDQVGVRHDQGRDVARGKRRARWGSPRHVSWVSGS